MVRKKNSGYVLLIAVFVVAIVMAAGFLVAASIHRQRWMHRQERQDILLTAMTDAAIAMALSRLWGDPDYEGGSEPFGEGTLTLEVRKIDGRHVEVTTHAKYWGGARSGRVVVRIDRDPPPERDPPEVLSFELLPPPAGGDIDGTGGVRN